MFIEGSEEIELLKSLGLTSSEAKIIVTLWRLGVASANQIAQVSGVAREAIYQIMPKLQEKSLIEEVITIPKKFKALPIHEVYAILLHRKYKENQELCKKVSNLIRKRRKGDSLAYNGYHEIVLVPTGGNEHFRITQQYEKVQKSVDLTFTAGKFIQWSQYYAEWSLKEIAKRNVKMQIVTEPIVMEHKEINSEIFGTFRLFQKMLI
ncbi:MAG: helix-turn-helix domain-containing protein [Candidatus Bathyarchaeia archaeon]